MRGLRRHVSLLISAGHVDAYDYPVCFVWEESELIVEQRNRDLAMEATLWQSAASTAVAAFGKDGGKGAFAGFRKVIDRLIGKSAGGASTKAKVHLGEDMRRRSEADGEQRR